MSGSTTEQSMEERYPEYLEQWQQSRQSNLSRQQQEEQQQEQEDQEQTRQPSPEIMTQPSRGFALMARSGASSRAAAPKKEDKYKFQYLGMLITAAWATYSIYFIYAPSRDIITLLRVNFFDNFTQASSFFPFVLMSLFTSYFFIKSIAVPSYAAGRNPSIKFWPLTVAEGFLHYQIMSRIFFLLFTMKDTSIASLKRMDTPLLILIIQAIVFSKYSLVSQSGDKEYFAFIKSWIIDEVEEDKMMSVSI